MKDYEPEKLGPKDIFELHKSTHRISIYQKQLLEFVLTLSRKRIDFKTYFDIDIVNRTTTEKYGNYSVFVPRSVFDRIT